MPTAIITGAGTGIGRAAALRLAKEGFAIVLVGRRPGPLEAVAGEIRADGGRAGSACRCDSRTPLKPSCGGQGCPGQCGCAGEQRRRSARLVAQLTPEQWRQILEVNLSAAFYLTRSLAGHAAATRGTGGRGGRCVCHVCGWASGGTIINISSMSSRDPFSGLGAYGAAKAGLNLLTLMTAHEGYEAGIRAVGIGTGRWIRRCSATSSGMRPWIRYSSRTTWRKSLQAASGALHVSSGETIFIHQRPA